MAVAEPAIRQLSSIRLVQPYRFRQIFPLAQAGVSLSRSSTIAPGPTEVSPMDEKPTCKGQRLSATVHTVYKNIICRMKPYRNPQSECVFRATDDSAQLIGTEAI